MDEGRKDDQGKLRWRLVPWRPMMEVVKVLNAGADKYGEHNWTLVPNANSRYWDAMMRHIMAWTHGEKNDPEDGLNHLAHAICCLLFLMWFDNEDRR